MKDSAMTHKIHSTIALLLSGGALGGILTLLTFESAMDERLRIVYAKQQEVHRLENVVDTKLHTVNSRIRILNKKIKYMKKHKR